MNLDLSDRIALVTGSTKGIGFAVAVGLARMGAQVVIHGRSLEDVNRAIERARLAVPQGRFTGAAGDLSIASEAAQVIVAVPQVDILVNNAGVYEQKEFFALTDHHWEQMLAINLMSGVRLARHYLKFMLAKDWGRIVNVSSETGAAIPPEMIHYGVSKAAQLAFSRGIAELTAGTNVTVNAVLPGPTWVETADEQSSRFATSLGVTQDNVKRDRTKEMFTSIRPTSLLRRYTTPEEVANMICFLCSPAACATNGAPVRVEGGIVRAYV